VLLSILLQFPRVSLCHPQRSNWFAKLSSYGVEGPASSRTHDDTLAIFATLTDRRGAPPFRRFLRKTVPEIVCCRTSALTDEHLLGDLKHKSTRLAVMEKPLKARPLANNARRAGHPVLSVVKAWASPPEPTYFCTNTLTTPGSWKMKSSSPSELKSAGTMPNSAL